MHPLRSLAIASLAACAISAHADTTTPLMADGSWNSFYFGAVGSPLLDDIPFNNPGQLSFSFTNSETVVLRVADLYLAGDRFAIYDNGTLLGRTTLPAGSAMDDAGADANLAFSSPAWSHGMWLLNPGTHVLTGMAIASPYDAGIGAVQLTAVPEPEAYAMLLSGLGLLSLIVNRRR